MRTELTHCVTYLLLLILVVGLGCSGASKTGTSETIDASPSVTDSASSGSTTKEPEPKKPDPEPVALDPLPESEGAVDGTFSISQVMKLAHQSKLYRSLFRDTVDPEVGERLVLLYSSLPQQSSPKGDADDWTKRSTALVDAAKQVVAGEDGSVAAFKRAVNCNSCHSRHKP